MACEINLSLVAFAMYDKCHNALLCKRRASGREQCTQLFTTPVLFGIYRGSISRVKHCDNEQLFRKSRETYQKHLSPQNDTQWIKKEKNTEKN